MPPSNLTLFNNNNTINDNDNDTVHTGEFPYDLLALIVPIGILLLIALYMYCLEQIYKCKTPQISRSHSGSSISLNSRMSIASSIIEINDKIFIEQLLKNTQELQVNDEICNKSCSICIEKYSPEDTVIKLSCEHYFHKNCIEEWVKSKKGIPDCPICRQNI